MYLTDGTIRARLSDFAFVANGSSTAFDAETQIQPCSVDLRLGTSYWRQIPRKFESVKRSRVKELRPRRNWRHATLKSGESLAIKPGEFVLGSTCEHFAVPPDCAANIFGRSSFGRMGLAVHCGASFINPGWHGRMPLILVNHGQQTIEIVPDTPICQVVFIKLDATPEKTYGHEKLFSKYLDDDGGPSYWWRDGTIKALQAALKKVDLSERIQEDIVAIAGVRDVLTIERMEKFVLKGKVQNVTNAADVLTAFAHKELWGSRIHRTLRALGRIGMVTASLALAALASRLISEKIPLPLWLPWVFVGLAPVAAAWGIYTFVKNPETIEFLTPDKLDAARSEQGKS